MFVPRIRVHHINAQLPYLHDASPCDLVPSPSGPMGLFQLGVWCVGWLVSALLYTVSWPPLTDCASAPLGLSVVSTCGDCLDVCVGGFFALHCICFPRPTPTPHLLGLLGGSGCGVSGGSSLTPCRHCLVWKIRPIMPVSSFKLCCLLGGCFCFALCCFGSLDRICLHTHLAVWLAPALLLGVGCLNGFSFAILCCLCFTG